MAPNLRIDAVRGAKTFGMDGSEKVIAYLEAVLQEEAMVLETVEDVARWIEDNAPFLQVKNGSKSLSIGYAIAKLMQKHSLTCLMKNISNGVLSGP